MSKKSLLIPAILIVLALAIVAVVLVLSLGGNGGNENDPLPIRFAKAVLTCDQQEISECDHENMADYLCNRYGVNDVRFEDCTATVSQESALLRDGLEFYSSKLNRDFGIQTTLESGCFYTVDFTAEYNGKDYSGTMTVLTVLFEGKEYVISVELDRMEDAFYQDNFPAGDYYYDMFGEY